MYFHVTVRNGIGDELEKIKMSRRIEFSESDTHTRTRMKVSTVWNHEWNEARLNHSKYRSLDLIRFPRLNSSVGMRSYTIRSIRVRIFYDLEDDRPWEVWSFAVFFCIFRKGDDVSLFEILWHNKKKKKRKKLLSDVKHVSHHDVI